MAIDTSTELTLDDVRTTRQAIEFCYDQGWTDGMPVVPAIPEFVDEFLAQTQRNPDEVLMVQAHLDRVCTVRLAAINAVMAGCKPEYFPVLLAAIDALEVSGARSGLLQSTTGQAQIMIVNGPARTRLAINSKDNIFGPGDRANATLGRALRLVIMNALGIRPHVFDQSTQGTSAKFAFCFGENEEESPWEPLHVERGFSAGSSTVTCQMARGNIPVEHRSSQVPEEILLTIADTMSYAGGINQHTEARSHHGAIVVLGPEHAHLLAGKGWSKADVKQFLYERFGRTRAELKRLGKDHFELNDIADDDFVSNARSIDAITIVVAGARNAGVSTVIPCQGQISTVGAGFGTMTTKEIRFKQA